MRVLFVAPGIGSLHGAARLASFHAEDLSILRGLGYEVRSLVWRGRPLLRLARGSRWADIVFCWNISDYSFAASLVAQRLVCVVGGYEFANMPDLRYGNMVSRRMRFITKWVWKRADALLYVDRSLEDEAVRAFGGPGRAEYVPTGYDSSFWTPGDGARDDLVLTVAHAPTRHRLVLKGVDLFLEVAKVNPDLEFHIVGDLPSEALTGRMSPNVVMDGWLEREPLRQLYRRAKAYCQLSLHEGLPNAVCEAMLCGCIPLGTKVNGIPTAIGDSGFLVERSVQGVTDGLRKALANPSMGLRARERIARTFPVERRRDRLSEILNGLVAREDRS